MCKPPVGSGTSQVNLGETPVLFQTISDQKWPLGGSRNRKGAGTITARIFHTSFLTAGLLCSCTSQLGGPADRHWQRLSTCTLWDMFHILFQIADEVSAPYTIASYMCHNPQAQEHLTVQQYISQAQPHAAQCLAVPCSTSWPCTPTKVVPRNVPLSLSNTIKKQRQYSRLQLLSFEVWNF